MNGFLLPASGKKPGAGRILPLLGEGRGGACRSGGYAAGTGEGHYTGIGGRGKLEDCR